MWFYNQPATAENRIRGKQRCRAEGTSIGSLRDEPEPFPVDDAGVQPELLADALQSRGNGYGRFDAAHDPGDRTAAVFVLGSEDLAPRGSDWGQL